jgi:hypothetical protein
VPVWHNLFDSRPKIPAKKCVIRVRPTSPPHLLVMSASASPLTQLFNSTGASAESALPAGSRLGRKSSVSRHSFEISAGWTFGNRKVPGPSRESSCFRRAPQSSMKARSGDTNRRRDARPWTRLSVPYVLLGAHSSLHVKEVGIDSLVGGGGESCDVVLLCNEGLDRASERGGLIKDLR